jgi:hypothetical protein
VGVSKEISNMEELNDLGSENIDSNNVSYFVPSTPN